MKVVEKNVDRQKSKGHNNKNDRIHLVSGVISSDKDFTKVIRKVDQSNHLENKKNEGHGHADVDIRSKVIIFYEEKANRCSHDQEELEQEARVVDRLGAFCSGEKDDQHQTM
jgi:hypothetical protein